MGLRERIQADTKDAMKARETARLSTLREKLEMLSAKGRIGCRDEKTATRTRKEWFFVK